VQEIDKFTDESGKLPRMMNCWHKRDVGDYVFAFVFGILIGISSLAASPGRFIGRLTYPVRLRKAT